jgi:hypothetical protein
MKVVPKLFGNNTSRGGKYWKGGTGRPNRLGYQLDQMTRRTEINRTLIEADGGDGDDFKHMQGGKGGIVLTTSTEVRWDDSAEHGKGSSTESLV